MIQQLVDDSKPHCTVLACESPPMYNFERIKVLLFLSDTFIEVFHQIVASAPHLWLHWNESMQVISVGWMVRPGSVEHMVKTAISARARVSHCSPVTRSLLTRWWIRNDREVLILRHIEGIGSEGIHSR